MKTFKQNRSLLSQYNFSINVYILFNLIQYLSPSPVLSTKTIGYSSPFSWMYFRPNSEKMQKINKNKWLINPLKKKKKILFKPPLKIQEQQLPKFFLFFEFYLKHFQICNTSIKSIPSRESYHKVSSIHKNH